MKSIDPDQLVEFIQKHGPYVMRTFWSYNTILEYVNWHIKYQQIAVIYQANGDVVGFGQARLVNRRKRSHFDDPWRYSDVGNTVYLEHLAVLHPSVTARLFVQMVKRFGVHKWVAAERHGVIRYWPFKEYVAKVVYLLSRMAPRPPQQYIFKKYRKTVRISEVEVNPNLTQRRPHYDEKGCIRVPDPNILLKAPILLAHVTYREKPYILVDGFHRIEVAKIQGDEWIDAEVIDVPESLKPETRIAVARIQEKAILI